MWQFIQEINANGTTIILTTHYLEEAENLCKNVAIINHGKIMYDGSLLGIIDRFSGHKMLSLQFGDGKMPGDLARYGEVVEIEEPKAKLRVERNVIAEVLSSVLASHTIEDVSVEDPPLEEVIAQVFEQTTEHFEASIEPAGISEG